MISAEVAKRYAHGLFLLALEKNVIDSIAEEMKQIDDLLTADRSLLNFLAAPQVSDQDKAAVVRSVFSGKVSRMLEEFLLIVIGKHRNNYLHEIAEAFDELVLDYKGFVKTRVVTAVPLTEPEKKSLVERLEKKSGKKVMAIAEVDASIIGGVIVFLGDQIIDKSVKHQLDLLRDELQAVKVH